MKRGVIVVLFLGMLFVLPLIQAQTYSGFNRFTDNAKLFFSSDKVNLALEIREKEVDSAIENFQDENIEATNKNLEKAYDKLQVVQEKVSLDNSEEIKTSVDEIIDKIKDENLSDEFEDYLLEEEKTQLTAVLTEKTYEYCAELAKEDFASMLQEEECNPDTSIPGLEKELEKLKDLQLRMFVQLMLEIRSCIDDPGTCNCEANVDVEQKAKCEKMVALAIRCEYKEDEISCNELRAMEPKQGDSFAESFVPGFLKNLFKEKSYMIEYDIQPSDGVPEECWDDNDKPECKQYAHLKETKEDWDAYGNYIGKRPEKKEPTMQESVPECFDGDVFLEEKCGKITVVRTEDGLVNYIVEKDVDGIIEEFENKSEQNNYAPGTNANGSGVGGGYAPGTTANGTDGQMQVQSKAMQIKQQMNQITNQIASITYAPGTGPGGRGGVVIDGDGQDVVTSGGGNNFVSNDVADDGNGGYAPGTSAGGTQGDDVVSGGDNVVDSGTVDSGTVDGGSSNDVAGVDPGPDGIVGTIVDPDAIDD